jgi:hypothetical protein
MKSLHSVTDQFLGQIGEDALQGTRPSSGAIWAAFIVNPSLPRHVTHMFGLRCRQHGIEHRVTKVSHPWTTDEVEQSFFA